MCDSLRDSSHLITAVRTPVPSLGSTILPFVCSFHILQFAVFIFSSRLLLSILCFPSKALPLANSKDFLLPVLFECL